MTGRRAVTVLTTCAASQLSVETIVALKRSTRYDVEVIAVDIDPAGVGRAFADHYEAVPPGDDPSYITAMLELCERRGVDVVVPASDEEALALASHDAAFRSRGTVCCSPAPSMVGLLRDKAAMYDHLRQAGMTLPDWQTATTPDEVAVAARALGYPDRELIVKPARARGGRGVWLLDPRAADGHRVGQGSADAVRLEDFVAQAPATMPPTLVMEHLGGDIFDVDMLTVAGALHLAVPRRRFNRRGIPFLGCAIERAEDVESLAQEVHARLELRYLIDIDVARDRDGRAHLLEVNPRQSGSMIATIAAGTNLMELLLATALDDDVPPVTIPYGRSVLPSVRSTAF